MHNYRKTILIALILSGTALASERTIKTRDGKTFAKAEITEVGAAAVKIVHDGGIAVVAKEALPAEIQKEIGYKTIAERQVETEQAGQEKQMQDTIQSQVRDEAKTTAKEKHLKDAFNAIKSATQSEANAFASMTRGAVIEKIGEPIRIEQTGDSGTGFTTLFYDERKATRTFFVIEDGKTTISRGLYKGVPIQRP